MPKYKLSLSTSAGELDSKEIEVSDEEMENSGEGASVTAALIEWLEDGLLVSDGDTITIREIAMPDINTGDSPMLFAGSIDDLQVLSEALTQYVANECDIRVEERGGSSPEVHRAQSMLDAVDAEIVARLSA